MVSHDLSSLSGLWNDLWRAWLPAVGTVGYHLSPWLAWGGFSSGCSITGDKVRFRPVVRTLRCTVRFSDLAIIC